MPESDYVITLLPVHIVSQPTKSNQFFKNLLFICNQIPLHRHPIHYPHTLCNELKMVTSSLPRVFPLSLTLG